MKTFILIALISPTVVFVLLTLNSLNCFSLLLAGLSDLLMWIFFAACFTNRRRNWWERASGIWLTAPLTQPEEGCCERLASFSDAIGCSLESRVCSHINDCWGDGGASMWSAWHLIEGRDAPLTAAVKTGREGHREHMKLSLYSHLPAFGLHRIS